MVFKPEDEEVSSAVPVNDKASPQQTETIAVNNEKENGQETKKKQSTEDLFNAHDFDITIDLEVPIPSKLSMKYIFITYFAEMKHVCHVLFFFQTIPLVYYRNLLVILKIQDLDGP